MERYYRAALGTGALEKKYCDECVKKYCFKYEGGSGFYIFRYNEKSGYYQAVAETPNECGRMCDKHKKEDLVEKDTCYSCKEGKAIALGVVNNFVDENNKGDLIFDGPVCETCIKEIVQRNNKYNEMMGIKKPKSNTSSSQSSAFNKNYWPWIIGGLVGVGVIVGLVVWLTTKKEAPKD